MKRYLFFVFLVTSVLFANSFYSAEKHFNEKNRKGVLNAYHTYKNLRINAIMQGNKENRIKALKGIIRSANFLRMDSSKYKKELKRLGVQWVQPTSVKSAPPKTTQSNILRNTRWRYGELILSFKYKLDESDVNYFILDKRFGKHYRYIFDIKAEIDGNEHIAKKSLHSIRIARKDKGVTRLVLENTKSLKVRYKRVGNELHINLGDHAFKEYKTPTLVNTKEYTNVTKSDRKRVIVIDPGHGGKDPGAVGYRKYREKIIVFDIAKALKKELKSRGYKVYMTRTRDKFIELRDRTTFANKKNADLFISVHANSVPRKGRYKKHNGVETYFLSPSNGKRSKSVAAKENSATIKHLNYFSKQNFLSLLNSQKILASNKLAIDLQKGMMSELKKRYRTKDAGVRKGPFWVLVGAQMPAVLVEVGFVTSPKEARLLVNRTYQKRMAKGLALGIENYFKYN